VSVISEKNIHIDEYINFNLRLREKNILFSLLLIVSETSDLEKPRK
jgi:hypothetical protein